MVSTARLEPGWKGVLPLEGVGRLIAALREDGREVVGPVARDGAICLGPIRSLADLPAGFTDEQSPGHYRLSKSTGDREGELFGYTAGQHAYKRALLLPEVTLVRLRRSADDIEVLAGPPPAPKLALFGARACDIAALGIHDDVLLKGQLTDADYVARRRDVVIIAVQCGKAGGTCFCASMGTGPRATSGFDLALTEILTGPHRFLVEIGSPIGAALASRIGLSPAPAEDRDEADRITDRTRESMKKHLDAEGLHEKLAAHLEDARWEQIAHRCLGCTNCTMVCPTCFCTTTEDRTDLTGEHATRTRRYDSCFSESFAYVHGGSVRPSLAARYRQWLTHKLSSWFEQFGTSGCVGCGRCITFCPVGIDISVEAAMMGNASRKGH